MYMYLSLIIFFAILTKNPHVTSLKTLAQRQDKQKINKKKKNCTFFSRIIIIALLILTRQCRQFYPDFANIINMIISLIIINWNHF